MAEDIEGDFKQIKISRLTLGLIMSVAVTSGVIVWNAAQVAGRISELEEWIDELDRDNGEELRWELDDLHHRSYAFEEALRSRTWGDEILREFLGW